jgi:hypothetical protein
MARAGRLGAVALALVLVIGVTHTGPEKKSNVQDVAAQIAPTLEPGDIVLATQPDQIPALRYYLGPQLAYATPLGPVRNPTVMDWRNALARLRAAHPEKTLVPLLDGLPDGRQVVLVRPTAVTHQTDTEQRVIPCTFARTGSDTISARAPDGIHPHALAPRGYYMLFVLNGDGVPSEGAFIHLH